jgi:hypothetical protein
MGGGFNSGAVVGGTTAKVAAGLLDGRTGAEASGFWVGDNPQAVTVISRKNKGIKKVHLVFIVTLTLG